MIFDIWENSSDNRCQISRLEANNLDQCVKMVLDYYVKPEFHESAYTDYADEGLTYVTIPQSVLWLQPSLFFRCAYRQQCLPL